MMVTADPNIEDDPAMKEALKEYARLTLPMIKHRATGCCDDDTKCCFKPTDAMLDEIDDVALLRNLCLIGMSTTSNRYIEEMDRKQKLASALADMFGGLLGGVDVGVHEVHVHGCSSEKAESKDGDAAESGDA